MDSCTAVKTTCRPSPPLPIDRHEWGLCCTHRWIKCARCLLFSVRTHSTVERSTQFNLITLKRTVQSGWRLLLLLLLLLCCCPNEIDTNRIMSPSKCSMAKQCEKASTKLRLNAISSIQFSSKIARKSHESCPHSTDPLAPYSTFGHLVRCQCVSFRLRCRFISFIFQSRWKCSAPKPVTSRLLWHELHIEVNESFRVHFSVNHHGISAYSIHFQLFALRHKTKQQIIAFIASLVKKVAIPNDLVLFRFDFETISIIYWIGIEQKVAINFVSCLCVFNDEERIPSFN